MSQINGDKARFHRERKQNILRRTKAKQMLEALGKKEPSAVATTKTKPAPSSS